MRPVEIAVPAWLPAVVRVKTLSATLALPCGVRRIWGELELALYLNWRYKQSSNRICTEVRNVHVPVGSLLKGDGGSFG